MPNKNRKFIFINNLMNRVTNLRKNRLLDNNEWFLARCKTSRSIRAVAREMGRSRSVIARRVYLMRKFDLELVPERMRSYL